MEQPGEVPAWSKRVWEGLGAVAGLIGLAAAIYGFQAYVDFRVEKITSTKEFLEKVAARVRPSLIFDADESVLSDAGVFLTNDNELLELVSVAGDSWRFKALQPRQFLVRLRI